MNTLNEKNEVIAAIPFSGFYQTIHDHFIDLEIENRIELDNDKDNEYATFRLVDSDDLAVDYDGYVKAYSAAYTDLIKQELCDLVYCGDLTVDLTFESVTSPQYYNYETDRIFATISKEDIKTLTRLVDMVGFSEYVKDRFTSCDGFVSSYSQYLKEWLKEPTQDWDHNQIGSMIAYLLDNEDIYIDNANEIASKYITIKEDL